MSKLPRSSLEKLRAAMPQRKLPDTREAGCDEAFEVLDELYYALAEDALDPRQSAARRHVAALVGMRTAVICDGLLIGVAVNQPGIVPVAVEASRAMKMGVVGKLVSQIAECVPDQVREMDDNVDDRLAWYQSEGEKLGTRLEELASGFDDPDFDTEIVEACLIRVLDEPDEFFAKH